MKWVTETLCAQAALVAGHAINDVITVAYNSDVTPPEEGKN